MAKKFQELVKNSEILRRYARDFYIYGFKDREEFTYGSKRSYDNERRRIESFFSEFIEIDYNNGKKTLRLAIDGHRKSENPFQRLWKSKSFTKNDIFLHFVLLDIFIDQQKFTIAELVELIDTDYLSVFQDDYMLDPLTIRKKVKEYVALGILQESKQGKTLYYQQQPRMVLSENVLQAIQFYKEVFPVGIIGEHLLARETKIQRSPYVFKHTFFHQTFDAEVTLLLLQAIHQHLVGKLKGKKRLYSIRLHTISHVKLKAVNPQTALYQEQLLKQKEVVWNAAIANRPTQVLKVFFSIDEEKEVYLIRRLEKEKRQGDVTRLEKNRYLFQIKLADMVAITPFLRTFFGRIEKIQCTNRLWEKQFWVDYQKMYSLYFEEEVQR
ncbi:hypothetical protein ABID30_001101 [Enterococcus rotai]|uniref:WYL domain-containing protein n=1 Tax=Enterococcus rotai TaxID=118060 RepID=A0A0U2VQH8_9ENTE|nr:hypothetical protein [Enterococcus rotai]ALS35684.1 hypothetical protein ATZ35_00480 [Enterococcus rotai]